MFSNTTNSRHLLHVFTLAVTSLLFFVPLRCEAQNLVPNPSFELVDTCPVFPAVLNYNPESRPNDWFSFSGSPDYFNACEGANAFGGVPQNILTFQHAQDGQAYSGMLAWLPQDHREMIGAELIEPLIIGQTYYGSFWANAAYGGNGTVFAAGACNHMGMLLTMEPYYWTPTQPVFPPEFGLRNYAQIKSDSVISDTVSWTLISGSFVADSAYRYVVIGNHFDNANTTARAIRLVDTVQIWVDTTQAYVMVDNICLTTDHNGCRTSTEIITRSDPAFNLWPDPCSAEFSLRWNGIQQKKVYVVDQLGRTVFQCRVMGGSGITIPVNDWAGGLYIVQVIGEGMKYSRKFIVKH